MDKAGLVKSIAEMGYNVGFGAKKHFATFDIVQKAPGWIAFVSLAIGVYALVWEPLSSKFVGASIVVLGIIGLYVSLYDPEKYTYEEAGKKLTQLFNRLRDLIRNVQAAGVGDDLSVYCAALAQIENEYYQASKSKQILFSDWYAHYKFFWQFQIDWVNEQKRFTLLRDKLPLSFMVFLIVTLLASIISGIRYALTFSVHSP